MSDASVLVELAAQLRDEGVDLDSTILDRVARGDNARLILDETNAKLLGRLHTRSDDFAATKALQTVSTAAARLGVNNGHGPGAPARRRAERTDVVPRVPPPLGDELALRRVRAGLLLAIVISLAWLVWRHPGPWQFGLAVAIGVALVLPTQVHRWVALGNVLHLDSLMGRIEALEPVRRWWQGIPVAGRATIPLLALFNTLIALLDAPALLSGVLVPSTILAFAAMCCVNLVVVNSWLRATPEPDLVPPPSYVVAPDAVGTIALPAPSHDGHPNGNGNGTGNGAHAHPAENGNGYGNGNGNGATVGLRSTDLVAPPVEQPPLTTEELPTSASPGRLQRAAAAGAALLAVGWIAYEHPGGSLLLLVVLLLGLAIPFTKDIDRHQATTMVLALAVGVATVDYVSWRFDVTNWQGWWIAVPLLLAETLGAIHVLGFQFTIWPRPAPRIQATDDPTTFPIFMLVPTLNEGVSVLRPTLNGCINARARYLEEHPGARVTIVVCNDGRAAKVPFWSEVDALAKELHVKCVTRRKGGGAKAGNIEHARKELQISGNALLAIFDADQIPEPTFLLEAVPPFADPAVGWVQTGQYYSNLENPVARWADDQQSMFYNLLCPGKAALNAAFICGTNVVIRGAALDEIGGFPQGSVTEDFAASIRLHPNWRSIYLPEVLAKGLGPFDIPAYLKQQGRWALGTLGVFRKHWRDILLPKKHGLRLGQRVQYFLACTHYLCGLRDLVFILSPMLFIATTIPAVRGATLDDYLWHFIPYIVLSATAMWYAGRGVTGLRGVIVGFGSFPALIGSLLAVVAGRRTSFAVTSKKRGGRSLKYLWIYAVLTALCLGSLVLATNVTGTQRTSLFISVLWLVYSLVLLGSFFWLVVADRRAHVIEAQSAVEAERVYPPRRRKAGLRPLGGLGLAALLATPLLMTGWLTNLPIVAPGASTPFAIGPTEVDAEYAGVSLPVNLLKSRPAALEQKLGIQFSVIGRTQEIGDSFDTNWADTLASQGGRPWITLLFGVFGPGGRRPNDANLPAIINGVQDDAIRRWANEIRDFGQPVYLTILPHMDKDWSLSSGVAHGGIPQDVPKAWTHVRSIFRAVGANNVAWVWAPADPARDQAFAPPSSTIDAVLQSFINYPGTQWGSPQKVLRADAKRHPGKPLIVEASASGPPAEKAAWLSSLGQAVDVMPRVHAVVYHEGGPGLAASSKQEAAWSMASDAQSLGAAQALVMNLNSVRRLK